MTRSNEIASVLLAQAWQITLLILCVMLCVRLVARSRPHLSHVLWLVVLLKCLTPPLWSSPAGVFCWLQTAPQFEQPSNSDAGLQDRGSAENAPPTSKASGPDTNNWQLVAPRSRVFVESKIPTSTSWSFWSQALVFVWIAGACCVLALISTQLVLFLLKLRSSGTYQDRDLNAIAMRLSKQVGLRRAVRVVITRGRIGPAVFGFLRPTILLPAAITRTRTVNELEPILAHELIHVRRADLWFGLLQLIAQALWWFHPLVRIAMQKATAEAERCCDEAVIALLRCDPASYARCLIDVLSKKQELMAVPAFPGVRPLDVTVTRLERIMKLGHGSRKRTPWWCWMVMGLVALVTLPGAGFVLQAEGQQQSAPIPQERTRAVPSPQPTREQPVGLNNLEVYLIDDLVEKVKNDLGCDEQTSREIILQKMRNENGIERSSPADYRRLETDGNRVIVQDTTLGHERLKEMLEALREYGFRQVLFNIFLIQGPARELVSVNSELSGSDSDRPYDQVRLLEVDPSTWLEKIRTHEKLKVVSSPRVIIEDSELAQMSIAIEDGREVSIALQPFLKGDRDFRLVISFANSQLSNDELVIPATENSLEQKIKPRHRRELQTMIRMSIDETLAVQSEPLPGSEGNEVILALVKAEIVDAGDIPDLKPKASRKPTPDETMNDGVPVLPDIPYVGRLFKR